MEVVFLDLIKFSDFGFRRVWSDFTWVKVLV